MDHNPLAPEPEKTIDVLGVGVTAVDEVLTVAHYPCSNDKTEVLERRRVCGGLTATALVAAARLGASAAYAGTIGTDHHSVFVLDSLSRAHVDVAWAKVNDQVAPVRSVIVVDAETGDRTIFFDTSGYRGPGEIPASLLRRTRVVLVDHLDIHRSIAAAESARAAGVPVVADIEGGEPELDQLVRVVDHLIVGEATATALTQTNDAKSATEALWDETHQAVVVTCGANGSWARDNDCLEHVPAFPIKARDTTGCGDVFHGAYSTAVAQAQPLRQRVLFASAAAALTAAHGAGGQRAAPTLNDVKRLLVSQPPLAPQ